LSAAAPPLAAGFAPGLSAALASPPPAAGAALPSAGSSPSPSIEALAALRFDDEGAAVQAAVGTAGAWEARSPLDGWRMRIAASFMRHDESRVREIIRQLGSEGSKELIESTFALRTRFLGLADILHAAHVRMLAGLARVALDGDMTAEALAVVQLAPDEPDPEAVLLSSRLDYVAEGDIGSRERGFFPGAPILVQSCDGFLGAGFYQLNWAGALSVRRCFQPSADEIHCIALGRNGKRDDLRLLPEAFADVVRGRVLAQLAIVDNDLANRLLAARGEL
jgi:hypothetical protein